MHAACFWQAAPAPSRRGPSQAPGPADPSEAYVHAAAALAPPALHAVVSLALRRDALPQSADTVVIYDPDPNPKNEEQAIAR